jgi:hypothetical protein
MDASKGDFIGIFSMICGKRISRMRERRGMRERKGELGKLWLFTA